MSRFKKGHDSQSIWSSEEERSTKHKPAEYQNCLVQLVDAFNQIYKYKEWMVPIGEANNKIDSKIIGETYIINGPAQSGKTCLVYWALRNDKEQIKIVTVDCSLYRTEMQFIQKLTKQIGEKIGVNGLDKRTVVSENIKFADLNLTIKERGIPIVLLIRNADRLVEQRKQILLYNLLEWISTTDIRKMVGLVFTTRLIYFVDRFQKRVRSRLSAKQIILHRPNPQNMLRLLSRRVECLIEQQKQFGNNQLFIKVYQKIFRCLHQNKQMIEVIRDSQQFSQKDAVYFLNAMKIVFCSFHSIESMMQMEDRVLKASFCQKIKESFQFIFPYIPKNLLRTCTYPEYVIMAIVYYMGKHERLPYCFKTIYEIYLQFKQKLVTSEGTGSSFTYSKNVLERAVVKLQELNLIELQSKEESMWNCDIRCALYPQDIKRTMTQINQIEKLPNFILQIMNC